MTACEVCGKETEVLPYEVGGKKLFLCKNCGKYGKALPQDVYYEAPAKPVEKQNFPAPRNLSPQQGPREAAGELFLRSDCAKLVREAREKKGLTQKELGQRVAETEGMIQRIERGSVTPPDELAKKLERFLGVTLFENLEPLGVSSHREDRAVTLGEIVDVKEPK